MAPSFLGQSPHPGVMGQKNVMVYANALGKQGTRVYTIGPERRVYTIETSDPEKKNKKGFYGGGEYFSLPCWTRCG